MVPVHGRDDFPWTRHSRSGRTRALAVGGLGEFLTEAVMMPSFFLLPIYMQDLLGHSALKTALALQPVSVALIVVAPVLSVLIGRIGPQPSYVAGTVALVGTLLILDRLPAIGGYVPYPLPATSLPGIGIVLSLITTPVIGTSQATEEDAGGRTRALEMADESTAHAMDIGPRDAFEYRPRTRRLPAPRSAAGQHATCRTRRHSPAERSQPSSGGRRPAHRRTPASEVRRPWTVLKSSRP